jgi:acyl-CoA synthetase (AMP-forming)/AMP-acid ligase II
MTDRLRAARARARTIEQTVRFGVRVGVRSGALSELTLPGVRAALTLLFEHAPFARAGKAPRTQAQIYHFHARNSADKVAFVGPDGSTLTYSQVDDRIQRAAAGLERRGLGPGSSVVLLMKNRPEFVEVQAGAGLIGAAAVSASWRSTPSEIAYIVENSRARALVFDADLWPAVEQAKRLVARIRPQDYVAVGGATGAGAGSARYEEDLLASAGSGPRVEHRGSAGGAVVVYTSGTTGKPKGAVRTFSAGTFLSALRFIAETPMRADDIHLAACPLYHSAAFAFVNLTGILGGTTVLMDEFHPQTFLDCIDRHGVTTTTVVPTMLRRVLSLGHAALAARDTRSLRAIFSGSAPLPAPLALETMDHFGDILFNFYGATETGLVTIAKPADLRAAPGTIGRVVPGNDVRLLDRQGRDVPEGRVGELYARSSMLVAGYHDDPESTRASMRDGFFSVGDLARRDGEGRYFLEGRARDMVISGGVNVYPAEVEAVLEQHGGVAEAAVVGVEDAEWGERVRAFVVRAPGVDAASLDEDAVRTWCRQRLAGPKRPRDVIFVDALPRNATGKVLKRELRELK